MLVDKNLRPAERFSFVNKHRALLGVFLLTAMTSAAANPENGVIVAGDAQITQTSAQRLDVNQLSDSAIINWQGFSIAADEHTHFTQPSADSVALNRVTGGDLSRIFGQLSADGRIFLVNPNGIVFGSNSQVDVSGLVASTADIDNADFLAGDYNFNIPGNPNASVINQGTITVADGGLAAFVAPGVANHGVIQAHLGKVTLAAGNRFTLDLYGDQLIQLAVDDEIAQQVFDANGTTLHSLVENSGNITADGGSILMLSTDVASGVVDNVINMNGILQANTVGVDNGDIVLKTEGAGEIHVAGTINAVGNGASGGDIAVIATQSVSLGGTIDISGGGTLLIDPATLTIDAAAAGTLVTALAGGGTVTVEASETIIVDATIDSSAQGNAATLHFNDENGDGTLTINLNADILLGANQNLTGEGSTVNVSSAGLIQNGVDVAANGATINVAPGTYAEIIDVDGRSGLNITGADQATTIIRPGGTINWNVGPSPNRNVSVRVVDSTDISFSNFTFEFADIDKTVLRPTGILYYNSSGNITGNLIQNMVSPNPANVSEVTMQVGSSDPAFTA
ncbi:MAG: filamentous hemagglutinin N-terminal domain-containing protein, partial [Gammaproteobacteria bacterium]|nr:filamentous hemagglutinin N-terminal domain-containing protein [Gammaproteobacteria bacterium]